MMNLISPWCTRSPAAKMRSDACLHQEMLIRATRELLRSSGDLPIETMIMAVVPIELVRGIMKSK